MFLKKLFKYVFILGFLLIIIGIIYFNEDKIDAIYKNLVYKDSDFTVANKNEYYREYDFMFVQNVDAFIANTKNDIKNIYYTGLNTGANSFDFKCSTKYKNCIDDVKELANDNTRLSEINNFVHPYNSFKSINSNIKSNNRDGQDIKSDLCQEFSFLSFCITICPTQRKIASFIFNNL